MNKKILVLMFLLLFLPLVGCLTPPNQTPIITSDPITTATVGVEYVYNVNATDPDGDTLTYSLDTKPSGMTIDSATGLIKWTPPAKGDYPVAVKISDGSLSIIQNFTIKVGTLPPTNQAPVIISTPLTTATVGVTYIYDVNATDPNGDTLTYSLITYYHSGMVINPANGLIMWTPTVKGNYVVVVEVSDGVLSDTQGFTITVSELPVVNQAPVITTTTLPNATVGTAYTAAVVATDADGDVLTFSLVSELTGMVISGAGVISGWTPTEDGTEDVTVTVTDGKDPVSADFTIEVTVPKSPVYNIDTNRYYDTITEAITDAWPGETIEVAAGDYPEYFDISIPLSIIGVSRDSVTIDTSDSDDYGIHITADDVTLKNFTLIGPPASGKDSIDGYGIYTSGRNNVVFENLLVKDSGRSGVNFIGCDGITVNNVEAINNVGAGIAITNSDNASVSNITTNYNGWGGMAVFTGGINDYDKECDNIVLTGNNSFGEIIPFYTGTESDSPITNLDVLNDFQYIVRLTFIAADGEWKIFFFPTKDDALNFATNLVSLGVDVGLIEVNDVITDIPPSDGYSENYFEQ